MITHTLVLPVTSNKEENPVPYATCLTKSNQAGMVSMDRTAWPCSVSRNVAARSHH